MAEFTSIEWADHTFNPWEGCQKTGSPACEGCYAEERNQRFNAGRNWGPGAPRRRTSLTNWRKPIKWNKDAEAFFDKHKRRQRVFCASLADVFDNAVDPQWRKDLFDLIEATPNLDWMLLTKRIGNVMKMVPDHWQYAFPNNVWIGATIVTQREADRDVPKLAKIPAIVRFVSMEPLTAMVSLRAINLGDSHYYDALTGYDRYWSINWVIAGGWSGKLSVPSNPKVFYNLRDQCITPNHSVETPFLFKQWGEYDEWGERVGKKHSGRKLAGVLHDGFPRGIGHLLET